MATKTKSIQSFCKNDQEFPVSGYTFATLGLFSALRFFPSPISFESLMISALESGAARLSNKLYVFTIAGQQIDIGPNCGDFAPGDGGSDVPSHPGLLSRPRDLALRAPGHPRPRQARQPRQRNCTKESFQKTFEAGKVCHHRRLPALVEGMEKGRNNYRKVFQGQKLICDSNDSLPTLQRLRELENQQADGHL